MMMIEDFYKTLRLWGMEARERHPNGVATWWPFPSGGYGYRCTCKWGGQSANVDVPSHCICGAKMSRDERHNADLPLYKSPWLVELEEKTEAIAAYRALPWYVRMFKPKPKL